MLRICFLYTYASLAYQEAYTLIRFITVCLHLSAHEATDNKTCYHPYNNPSTSSLVIYEEDIRTPVGRPLEDYIFCFSLCYELTLGAAPCQQHRPQIHRIDPTFWDLEGGRLRMLRQIMSDGLLTLPS
jgi:hypothetical protein